jgi:hypothetical protein
MTDAQPTLSLHTDEDLDLLSEELNFLISPKLSVRSQNSQSSQVSNLSGSTNSSMVPPKISPLDTEAEANQIALGSLQGFDADNNPIYVSSQTPHDYQVMTKRKTSKKSVFNFEDVDNVKSNPATTGNQSHSYPMRPVENGIAFPPTKDIIVKREPGSGPIPVPVQNLSDDPNDSVPQFLADIKWNSQNSTGSDLMISDDDNDEGASSSLNNYHERKQQTSEFNGGRNPRKKQIGGQHLQSPPTFSPPPQQQQQIYQQPQQQYQQQQYHHQQQQQQQQPIYGQSIDYNQQHQHQHQQHQNNNNNYSQNYSNINFTSNPWVNNNSYPNQLPPPPLMNPHQQYQQQQQQQQQFSQFNDPFRPREPQTLIYSQVPQVEGGGQLPSIPPVNSSFSNNFPFPISSISTNNHSSSSSSSDPYLLKMNNNPPSNIHELHTNYHAILQQKVEAMKLGQTPNAQEGRSHRIKSENNASNKNLTNGKGSDHNLSGNSLLEDAKAKNRASKSLAEISRRFVSLYGKDNTMDYISGLTDPDIVTGKISSSFRIIYLI